MKPKNILQRVLKFARTELERRSRAQDEFPSDSLLEANEQHERPFSDVSGVTPAEGEHEVRSLELVHPHDGGALLLRWSLTEEEVARAERLIQGNPVLCLRVVSFTKARDDVLREVKDRPGVERSGQCELSEPPQRGVISLGLRAGERFVSIAHHVL